MRRALSLLPVIGCVIFGFVAAEHVPSLLWGTKALWSRWQAALVSESYSYGPRSVDALTTPVYRAHLVKMGLHMAFGGLALAAGVTQFFPSLRRQYPRLHRRLGLVTVSAVAASMVGALAFLLSIHIVDAYGGPVFYLGLFGLALQTLGALAAAMLAIRARRFRAHMGWMAVAFAGIFTAPLLRLEWIAFGWWTPLTLEQADLAGAMTIVPLALVLLGVWMTLVGDAEFPAARSETRSSPRLWIALSLASVLVVIHEAILAPRGIDLWSRSSGERLPAAAIFWGVAALAALADAPSAMREALAGRLRVRTQVFGLATCAGMMMIAIAQPSQAQAEIGLRYFWGGSALLGTAILALAQLTRESSSGRRAWAVMWQFLLLLPLAWPLLVPPFRALGVTLVEAFAAASTAGASLLCAAGFLSGFAIELRSGT